MRETRGRGGELARLKGGKITEDWCGMRSWRSACEGGGKISDIRVGWDGDSDDLIIGEQRAPLYDRQA
jgi:hypothetical protein